MATWQIQHAKAQFSEVVEKAQSEGPQFITRHGTPRAVIVSAEKYEALRGGGKTLADVLLAGPKSDAFAELLERDRTPWKSFEFDSDAE